MLTDVAALEGSALGMHVRLHPVTTLACPQGHEHRFCYPDWGLDLTNEVIARYPVTQLARGLLQSGERCYRCRRRIDARPDGRATTTHVLELRSPRNPGVTTITLEAEADVVTCTSCGLVQAAGASGMLPWEALGAAFASVGLR